MVEQLSNQKSWKPLGGLIYFIGAFALLLISGMTLNRYLGMIGLVLSQLLFLAYAIGVTKLHKTPLKEVFPVKMISVKEFFGTVIFAVGAILANIGLAGLGMVLFPQGMENVQATTDFLYGNGLPPMLIVFIVSLTPAICEEALMRGAFLSHFRGLKNEWAVMAIVGVGFGLLHTSTIKFLSTGFLGFILAYVLIKKKNIVLCSMIHFLNNFLSSLVGVLSASQSTDVAADKVSQVSSISVVQGLSTFFMMAAFSFCLLLLGAIIMGLTENSGKKWIIAVVSTVVFFGAAMGLSLYDSMTNSVASFSSTVSVTEEGIPLEFNIPEDGDYIIVMSTVLDKGSAHIEVTDDNGQLVTSDHVEKGMGVVNQTVTMSAGKHYVTLKSPSSSDNGTAQVQVQIRNVAS